MQAIFAVITVLVTLMTGGYVLHTDPDRAPDLHSNSTSSQADDEDDRGPAPDPWG